MKHSVGITRLLTAATVVLMPMLSVSVAYAASASMYLSGTSNVLNGNTITLSVVEDSGSEPVNAVQANISYPANLLQFLSINNSAAFGVAAQSSGGGGSIQIGRGALPAVSGAQTVATISFKALAGSGTATLAFTSGSSVVSANTNSGILTSDPGFVVSFTSPAPASSGGSTSHGSSSSSAPPASTPTPKDTTPPALSKVAVSNITSSSATITWTTNKPATSEVDYGLSASYGLSGADNTSVTSHSVTLHSALIVPGMLYHFVVKSVDQSGNAAAGSDLTFTTTGTSLLITLQDQSSNKLLKGASVVVNGTTYKTDSLGQVTIPNLPTGKLSLLLQDGNTKAIETVDIESPSAAPQKVFFKLASTQGTDILLILVPIVIIVALAGVLVIGKQLKTRGQGQQGGGMVMRPQPPIAPSADVIDTPSHNDHF